MSRLTEKQWLARVDAYAEVADHLDANWTVDPEERKQGNILSAQFRIKATDCFERSVDARKQITVVGYRSGSCRNTDTALSHTYAMMSDGELWPMCGYGWNRSNGSRFSILRGSPHTEGGCKLCRKNVAAKREPVRDGFKHKTRWL